MKQIISNGKEVRKVESVTCPYCEGTMHSASWEVGKVVCIYCKKEFFYGEKKGQKAYRKG